MTCVVLDNHGRRYLRFALQRERFDDLLKAPHFNHRLIRLRRSLLLEASPLRKLQIDTLSCFFCLMTSVGYPSKDALSSDALKISNRRDFYP